MKMRVFVVVILCGVAVYASAPAQDPGAKPNAGTNQAPPATGAPKTESADPQSEEIEIMRRLLDRTLAALERKFTGGQLVGAAFGTNDTGWLDYNHTLPYTLNHLNMPSTYFNPYQSTALPATASYAYASGGQVWDTGTGKLLALRSYDPHAVTPELRGAQGVYLKGYGVVYTATIPVPPAPTVDPKKPAPKPLTEWERERLNLRGEKVEKAKAVAPQEALTDALLKVLADNGKHFSQLGETEQLTVVLTLPRGQSCTQCHLGKQQVEPKMGSSTTGSTSSGGTTGSTSGSGTTGTGTSGGNYQYKPADVKDIEETINGLKKDAQKSVLLGDLHLKQGKNDQAAAAFEEALKLYLKASESLSRIGLDIKGTPDSDASLERELTATVGKLIQVYSTLGKVEELKKTLKLLDQHVQKIATEQKPAKPAEPPAKVELPAKLVISAPKKLLDLVGSGKLTFEEFRKNATIEYQPARTIEK